jgi:hypothetical protein
MVGKWARQAREIDPAFPIIYITAGQADQRASEGTSEEHPFDQAARARSTCHRRFPASQYRYADNVKAPHDRHTYLSRGSEPHFRTRPLPPARRLRQPLSFPKKTPVRGAR